MGVSMKLQPTKYVYFAYEKCIKEIRKIHLDEHNLIDELHQKLSKGLLVTSGADLKDLKGKLAGLSRIKLGKNNEYRLSFKAKPEGEKVKVVLLQFGKTEDTNRKDEYYKTLEKWWCSDARTHRKRVQIKHYNYESVESLKKYLSDGYRFVIRFSTQQDVVLKRMRDSTNKFFIVEGTPGTGKSILAAHLALETIEDEEKTVLIITPNERLIQIYEFYLLNNGIEKERINRYGRNSIFKNKINIATLKDVTERFVPESKSTSQADAIEALRENHKILQLCNFQDKPKLLYEYYNAFFNEQDEIIKYSKKDALFNIYIEKILNIHTFISELTGYLNEKKIISRRHVGYKFMREVINHDNSDLLKFVQGGNHLTLIIDEIQDLLSPEWNAFLNLFVAANKTAHPSLRFAVLGDEKQRVTISGFTWVDFTSKIYEVLNKEFTKVILKNDINKETLRENYRVPKSVATFIESMDAITEDKDSRHVLAIKPEYCTSEGERIKIIQSSDKELIRAFDDYNSQNKTDISSDSKLLLVTENIKIKDKYIAKKELEILSLYEVKGTEFDHLVLLNPFQDTFGANFTDKTKLITDENYKLYTLFTRTRNALTVILNKNEMNWFQQLFEESIKRGTVEIISESDEVIALKKILEDNGLESLTHESIIKLNINRIKKVLEEPNYSQPTFYSSINSCLLKILVYPFLFTPLIFTLKEEISVSLINYSSLNNALRNSSIDRDLLIICWAYINQEPFVMWRYLSQLQNEELKYKIRYTINSEFGSEFHALHDTYKNIDLELLPENQSLFQKIIFSMQRDLDRTSENIIITKEISNYIKSIKSQMEVK
jgi:hypothetical protein